METIAPTVPVKTSSRLEQLNLPFIGFWVFYFGLVGVFVEYLLH
jgi:hypothetical protein